MLHRSKRSTLASESIHGFNHTRLRNDAMSSILSNGLPYSSKLSGHASCVNALAFSSGDGRFLASGGDDLKVCLWDFHQENLSAPTCSFHGPRGNILSLAFSTTNRCLYSGGTDEMILKYDATHLNSPVDTTFIGSPDESFRDHEDTIRGITCHPYHDEVFLSASQDGRILQHDGRQNSRSTRAQSTLQLASEATGVQFHPIMEHVFVTSDSRGHVCLRDTRMAFGPLKARTRQGIVHTYNTKLSKRSNQQLSNPEASSVTFDRDGTKLAVTMLHYLPTIYSLSDPNPLAVCSGRNLPNGTPISPTERTYSNSCTIKHGSFGSFGLDSDQFYSAGSEDFRAYVWKIPPISELAERRVEVSPDDWAAREWPNTIAFTENTEKPRYIPVDLSTPAFRLTGHRSIVNSTLIHPHLLHMVTSGIEKNVILHSPTASSPCANHMQRTSTDVRALGDNVDADRSAYLRAIYHGAPEESGDGEQGTIMMFDHILREESDIDVFGVRVMSRDSDSSDEDDLYRNEEELSET